MKKYLKDMDKKEIEKIISINEKFKNIVWENIYDENMVSQKFDTEIILGNNWHKYIDYHDNYTSFYLKIENYNEFIENVDITILSENDEKIYNECLKLKNKINDIENIMYNFNISNDEYNKNDEELEKITKKYENKCDELLENIENYLHIYENVDISDNEIIDYIIEFYQDEKDYYINIDKNGNSDYILKRDFTKIYC